MAAFRFLSAGISRATLCRTDQCAVAIARGKQGWQAGCQSVCARNVLKTGVDSFSWARGFLKRGTGGSRRLSGMRSAAPSFYWLLSRMSS